MNLLLVPILLLGHLTPARAADGHGPALAPCATDALGPLVAWSPGLAAGQTWTACVTGEQAQSPVIATVTDAEGADTFAALDDLWGIHAAGGYGFGRVGVGVDVPIWLASTAGGEPNGASLGDVRVYAPISIVKPAAPGGVGLDGVVEVVAGTGSAESLLGGGYGGGGHLVLGGRGDRFGGAADLGVGYANGSSLTGLNTSLWTRLALSGDWKLRPNLGLGAELWLQVAPLSGATIVQASPGEALLRIGAKLAPGLTVTAAGGTAITPGVGAAQARAYLRVGYASVPTRAVVKPETPVVVVPKAPGPFDVLVSVHDGGGRAIDARLSWEGAAAPPAESCGADGEGRATLTPGPYRLTVTAPGFGEQRRDFALAADRFRPERVQVILLPVAGEGTLHVAIEDSEGRHVSGATLAVDGHQVGSTGSGGTVEVVGVTPGEHVVTVAQTDFREHGAVPIRVPQASTDIATIVLERPPGSVHVITRGLEGPVPDARVRFSGPEDLPPENIGQDGERTFTLLPGHWTLVASAQDLGTQEREFEVEAGKTALVLIEVRMRHDEGGAARLVVRVVDPEGAPVNDAEVVVDGESVGHTTNGGNLTLADLKLGDRVVSARAERFRDAPSRPLTLAAGTREVTLPLAWRPGQVHLMVRGVEGGIVDARVRFSGPGEVPATSLGPDGEGWFELAPGTWTLAISSATYGLQEREVEVRSDDISLVDLNAGLLSADGDAALGLRVVDKRRVPVEAAEVWVDDRSVGTTASAGSLDLAGLRTGKHVLRVEAAGMKVVVKTFTLGAGRSQQEVQLDGLARTVNVYVKAPAGPALDALVRGYGSEALPPAPVGTDGHRTLALDPGPWTLVAVSEHFGIAQRDVDVKPGVAALPVDLVLTPSAPDRGTLLVEVVDPAGRPVRGASLTVDGVSQTLGATGIAVLADRQPAAVKLNAIAPGYRAREPESVAVDAGVQTRRLRLEWAPRAVELHVTNEAGVSVEAEVRLLGPGRTAPARSQGGNARFELRPGTWQVIASAKGYGPWRAEIEVEAGVTPLPVAAVLAAEKVEVTGTSVVIREQVQFAFDKADIDPISHAVLGQVASTLLVHPEIVRIEVQGHSDNRGTEVYNLDLSQRRAEAVRAYLVGQGVEPGRIDARGYGSTRPLVDNTTEAGRAKNRRVQFEIAASAAPPAKEHP